MDSKKYSSEIKTKLKSAYKIALDARKKGYDPRERVDIPLARDMAERVEGLISAVVPQIVGSGVSKRITEIEKKYGALDWRVSLTIAEEIAKQKFCKFETEKEAMEVGIRVAFAYHTLGTVASPLEGFTDLKLKQRKDGKTYFSLFYSGPIRSAGGTGASVSVLIADYVRKKMGYDPYDPSEDEISRMVTEIYDYHERITNLQYLPSEEEIRFLVKNLPVQIDGDPSEKIEVSNYKDLGRIETNRIRNGVCLCLAEALAQKAPKLWKQISKWGNDFDLGHWKFLEEFVEIQKRVKTRVKETRKTEKITPDYTFIKDLVAGRPILTYPLRNRGFRLRYGRCRTSGFSSAAIHPSTMLSLKSYIATGTQLKLERPGKAAVVSPCSTIEGPILKLKDGSVVRALSKSTKEIVGNIEEILFVGDLLINYGDFLNRAHPLVPAGYCEEWWIQELEKATVDLFGTLDLEKLSELLEVPLESLKPLLENPLTIRPLPQVAVQISEKMKIPLHPFYTPHWKLLSLQEFSVLIDWLDRMEVLKSGEEIEKIVLPMSNAKRVLELLGVPHIVVSNEFVVIEKEDAIPLIKTLNLQNKESLAKIRSLITANSEKNPLDIVNLISDIPLRDKSGTFIGARMGRPEKAKMRKLIGSPNVLFPVGEQGGRLRSFQSALEAGLIRSDFPSYFCGKCNKETIFPVCETCDRQTKKRYFCQICGTVDTGKCKHGETVPFKKQTIDIKHYFNSFLKKIDMPSYPDLIKGVRGTSNKDHFPEHLIKGILRAKYNICVNKDGTTRYDMTQMAMTHFKPKEIRTSVEKLKELGYSKDIYGAPLERDDQILELSPQDIVLPSCQESLDEGADTALFRVSKFIDELLVKLYRLNPFYKLDSEKDLVGHLVLAIAPHTSAAIVGRIIGFSNTQGFFAHPLLHAATRRDCVFPTTKFICIENPGGLRSYEIGSYVDSLISKGAKTQVIDSHGTLKVENKKPLLVLGLDPATKKLRKRTVKYFVKGPLTKKWIKIKTATGREQIMTPTHKFMYLDKNNRFRLKRAKNAKIGDRVAILKNLNFGSNQAEQFNILKQLIKTVPQKELPWIRIEDGRDFFKALVKKVGKNKIIALLGIDDPLKGNLSRLYASLPLDYFKKLVESNIISYEDLPPLAIRTNFNLRKWPTQLTIDKNLAALLGYYTAEGHSRQTKTVSQVSFRISSKPLQDRIISLINTTFGVSPAVEENRTKITICNKLIYLLFKYCFKTGSGAYDKKVPDILYNCSNELARAYISAFFDGDGSIIPTANRICFYSVNKSLLSDLALLLAKFGLVGRFAKTKPRLPGKLVLERYKRLGKAPKKHVLHHLSYSGRDFYKLVRILRPAHEEKKLALKRVRIKDSPSRSVFYGKKKYALKAVNDLLCDFIKDIEIVREKKNSYCLEIDWRNDEDKNILWGEQIINARCDGDEASVILLLDALINFSRDYLPAHRGSKQDAPLVLIPNIVPAEVDDMVFDLDVVWRYPLEFYAAALEYKNPWDVGIETLGKFINNKEQKPIGFTHHTSNFNLGVNCSKYKTLPTMEDKLKGQMELAEQIFAVDQSDVARLVIEKHFLKDTKGQLRKFSMQQFRCVSCNEKYRRPPLMGRCLKCTGRIIFTISEGSVTKYLGPSISLAQKYDVSPYLKQSLDILQKRVESVFGKEKEKQVGLGAWFG